MSNSFATAWTVQEYRHHGATRLLCPWDFPGKNTGVGCHFLLQGNLPNPEVEIASLALGRGFFTTEPLGRAIRRDKSTQIPVYGVSEHYTGLSSQSRC